MPFSISYALQNIPKHKKRSFAIAVGFLIGVCMVTAFMTWTDTGTVVFAKEHLKRDFQLVVTKPSSLTVDRSTYEIYNETLQTVDNIRNDPLVGRVEVVYSTFGQFNSENMSNSDVWYPIIETASGGQPVLNASVFIANSSFLELFCDELNLVGNLSMDKDSVLMSRNLIAQINETTGIEYKVGSNLNFSIATRIVESIYFQYSAKKEDTFQYWERVFLKNVTVAGTYDWNPSGSYMANNLRKPFNIQTKKWSEPDLVWTLSLDNSIFVPSSLLGETTLAKLTHQRPPTIFVQVDHEEAINRGINNLDSEASKLKTRISYLETGMNVVLLPQIWEFINAYTESRTLLIFVLPAMGLSVCVTIFGSEVTFKERKKEVGVLRSKGATYSQLYVIYIVELLSLIFLGSVLGFIPGILLGCAIPATTGFLQYDMIAFKEFLANVAISPYTFVFSLAVCGIVPLIYALYKANSYASTEVIKAMAPGIREGEERESIVPYVLLMILILGVILVILGYAIVLAIFGYITTRENIIFYALLVVQWMALGCFAALILTKALPKFSKVFSFILKNKGKLITLGLQRQKIFTSLMVVLVLVSSIMVFSLVETETTRNNLMNEIKYAIGSNLRITTLTDQPVSFSQNLTEKSNMFEIVMPVLSSSGGLADFNIRMIGVDPSMYKTIGFWTSGSILSPTYEQALDSLAADQHGAIISEYIVNALRLKLGDTVRTKWKMDYHDFIIVGIMHSAPGFGEAEPSSESVKRSLGFQENRFIIVNSHLFIDEGANTTSLFFASLKEEANEKETCEQLSKLPEVKDVYSPSTFDLSKVDIYRFLYMQGVSGALILQFLVTTVIGVVSLALYLDYIASGRSVEYAVMRAVGATRRNVTALIFLEAVEVIVLSLVVGSLLGITYSIFLFELLLRIFPFRSLVPYTFVIPTQTILLGFGIMLLAMILGSYLPARKAGRTDVARVLRNL